MAKYILLSFLLSATLVQLARGAVVGCYWSSWSYFRNNSAKFTTDDIDGSLCTHVYYSFIGLDNNTLELSFPDSEVGIDAGGYANFTALKTQYPNTKFLVSIGGWNAGSYAFSAITADSARRTHLIEQILAFIEEYGFDGLDFAWNYPTERDTFGASADRDNFATVVKEAKVEFEARGLLLTAAVGAPAKFVQNHYDLTVIAEQLDLINFMSHDIHGFWDNSAGTNGPLFDPNSSDNVNDFINAWIDAGVAASKIVLGVPFFGISYTLADSSDTSYGAAVTGVGAPGPDVRLAGVLAYYEILAKQEEGWSTAYDESVQTPYSFSGDQWVGYDDERSIAAKVSFAASKGLGGVMAWSLDFDDFKGLHGYRYPLLNALNQINQVSYPSAN